MPGLGPCADKSPLGPDEKKYLLDQSAMHQKNGLSIDDADRRAVQEFQHKTLDSLSDIYNQVGIKGFEPTAKSNKNVQTTRRAAAPGSSDNRSGTQKEKGQTENSNIATQGNAAAEHPATGRTAPGDDGILEARHANTEHDEQNVVSGQNKLGLSDLGKEDAATLRDEVKDNHTIKKVISSDLPRAKQTADIVADGKVPVETRPGLRSWDLGDFSGMKDSEFKPEQKYFADHPDELEHGGKKLGESFNDYKDRVIQAREEVVKEPEGTMLINHSNNMAIYDAYKKNGSEWTDQAKQDYLNTKTPDPATIVHAPGDSEAADAVERGEISDNELKKHVTDAIREYVPKTEEEPSGEVRKSDRKEAGDLQSDATSRSTGKAAGNEKRVQENSSSSSTKGRPAESVSSSSGTPDKALGDFDKRVEAAFAGTRIRGKVIEEKGDRVTIQSDDGTKYPVSKKDILKQGETVIAHYDAKPKLGERGKGVTPTQYSDPQKALDAIKAEHPDDPLMNRTADFLRPILKANSKIHIEDADLGGDVLGLAHPGGKVQVDFSAHGSMEEAHRTILHELMHQVTRSEITKNPAFREEVRSQLEAIRQAMGLPKGDIGDTLIPALVSRGIIEAHKYGTSNEHELLAEVFSNQKFRDLLSNMKAPDAPNMLHRVYTAIVKYFNRQYGALQNVKGKISASDMADYLQQLTEKTVTAPGDQGGILAKLRGETEEEAEVRKAIAGSQGLSDAQMKKSIMQWGKLPEEKVDQLLADARKMTPEEKLSQRMQDIAANKKTLDGKIDAAVKLTAEEKAAIKNAPKGPGVIDKAVDALTAKATAVKDAMVNMPHFNNMDRAIGEYSLAKQKNDQEVMNMVKDFTKLIPDKVKREAIANWIEAGGDSETLEERARDSGGKFKKGYIIAQHLKPSEVEMAKGIQSYFDGMFKLGYENGILKSQLHDYMTHIGVKEDNPIANGLMTDIDSGKLNTSFKYAKQRTFETFFDLEKAGYSAKTKDAANILGVYSQTFNKALYSRAFIKNATEGKASDGRPLIAQAGMGQQVPGEHFPLVGGPADAMMVNPFSKPEKISDYKSVNHFALRDWYWATQDAEGHPVFAKGDLVVHPEEYKRLSNMLGKSALRDTMLGRAGLAVSNVTKRFVFSVSPFFHYIQEGTHAIGHTINPVTGLIKEIDFNNPDHALAAKTGTMFYDHTAQADYQEGLSANNLLKNLPIYNKTILPLQEHLFNSYIPRLKMTTWLHSFERNLRRNAKAIDAGTMTREEVGAQTSTQMNAAYGHLNYDLMGRNKTTQDVFRMLAMAPDFLEARARFVGQAATKFGAEQRRALLVLGATQYLTARIMNKSLDDDYHFEWQHAFSVIHDGKEYSMRSVPSDLVDMLSDPGHFFFNRVSPFSQGIFEGIQGYDPVRGRAVDYSERAKDILTMPMPSAAKEFLPDSWNKFPSKPGDEQMWNTFINTIGIREKKAYTPMEKDISSAFYNRFPKGAPTEQGVLEHQIYQASQAGDQDRVDDLMTKLPPDQQKTINKNLASGKSVYEQLFSRLPKEDKIRLYNKMTDDEQDLYDPKGKMKKILAGEEDEEP